MPNAKTNATNAPLTETRVREIVDEAVKAAIVEIQAFIERPKPAHEEGGASGVKGEWD